MTAALRVTERELRFFALTWRASAFSTLVGPLLMLGALGIGLGGLIEERATLGGLDYLVFLAPGLAMGIAALTGTGMSLWPIMAGHRWLGFHRAMVASPVGTDQVVVGYLGWVMVRTGGQGVVFIAVAALLGAITSPWAVLAPLLAALTAGAYAAPVMAYTARCDSDRSFDPIMRVGVTPLYLFSGSFFPTTELPAAVALVVKLFPLWHGVEVARWLTAGQRGELNPLLNLAVLVAWIGVGVAIGRFTFARRLTP